MLFMFFIDSTCLGLEHWTTDTTAGQLLVCDILLAIGTIPLKLIGSCWEMWQ